MLRSPHEHVSPALKRWNIDIWRQTDPDTHAGHAINNKLSKQRYLEAVVRCNGSGFLEPSPAVLWVSQVSDQQSRCMQRLSEPLTRNTPRQCRTSPGCTQLSPVHRVRWTGSSANADVWMCELHSSQNSLLVIGYGCGFRLGRTAGYWLLAYKSWKMLVKLANEPWAQHENDGRRSSRPISWHHRNTPSHHDQWNFRQKRLSLRSIENIAVPLAPSRWYSGSGYWMTSDKFYTTNPVAMATKI